jgi:CBS domain-containing protein
LSFKKKEFEAHRMRHLPVVSKKIAGILSFTDLPLISFADGYDSNNNIDSSI